MPRSALAPITDLFTTFAAVAPGSAVLLLHNDDPALARWLVDGVGPEGRVTALHSSHSALSRLARLPGVKACEDVYPDPIRLGFSDAALVELPKGRSVARATLWTVGRSLNPGAPIYLAGPNASGAKSAIKDATALFGAAPVLGYRSGCRLAMATCPAALTQPPDWETPAPWQVQLRGARRPEAAYQLVTQPGVFSWEHLDDGTALLLDHLGVEPETEVLDLGCGYGIIGLAAARAGARVTMVDDDLLAVRCARASVRANELEARCTVLPSDVFSALDDRRFDLILSNPPFHQGVDVSTSVTARLIREAPQHLNPGGRLRLVANRFLAYERLMQAAFGSVTTVVDTGRYHVLEAALVYS